MNEHQKKYIMKNPQNWRKDKFLKNEHFKHEDVLPLKDRQILDLKISKFNFHI